MVERVAELLYFVVMEYDGWDRESLIPFSELSEEDRASYLETATKFIDGLYN